MTDLEITRLCAEAMALEFKVACELWCGDSAPLTVWTKNGEYQPLHDDAQAMALVKKFRIWIAPMADHWQADFYISDKWSGGAENRDLNRTICECVAKMRNAKVAE